MTRPRIAYLWVLFLAGFFFVFSGGQSGCPPECIDSDGDGYGAPASQTCLFPELDCDDTDPDVNPGMEESDAVGNCEDGKDNDCDGNHDFIDADCSGCWDQDGDTYFDAACGGNDCDDADADVNPGADDRPDDDFVDLDCDGIDGDIGRLLFVDGLTGEDTPFGGTPGDPLQTIGYALITAGTNPSIEGIAVSEGTYDECIIFVEGISLHGAYSMDEGWQRSEDHVSAIEPTTLCEGRTAALQATNITAPTTVAWMSIAAGNAGPGDSSYGMISTDSPGLILRYCDILAGPGGDGVEGQTAEGRAENGGQGNTGGSGCEDSDIFCDSCSRPQGGAGGHSYCGYYGGRGGNAGHGGSSGSIGSAASGGAQGGPGAPSGQGNWDTPLYYWGDDGVVGSGGAGGAAGQAAYLDTGYAPGAGGAGLAGTAGQGGGGVLERKESV
ncbi:putative metal-binding motif-containing protein, partial [Thermodesulfobacteriota bacterium]